MSVLITRTIYTLVVTPDEEVRHRMPLLKGQRLTVRREFEEDDEFDYLSPVGGGIIAVPPDAWERELFSLN